MRRKVRRSTVGDLNTKSTEKNLKIREKIKPVTTFQNAAISRSAGCAVKYLRVYMLRALFYLLTHISVVCWRARTFARRMLTIQYPI